MNKIKKFIMDIKDNIDAWIHVRRIRRMVHKYQKQMKILEAGYEEVFGPDEN